MKRGKTLREEIRVPRTCGGELFCALSDWFSFILPSLLYASLLGKYHHVKHRLPMLCYTKSMLHESALIVINMKVITMAVIAHLCLSRSSFLSSSCLEASMARVIACWAN